jgi:hypothetical protein
MHFCYLSRYERPSGTLGDLWLLKAAEQFRADTRDVEDVLWPRQSSTVLRAQASLPPANDAWAIN